MKVAVIIVEFNDAEQTIKYVNEIAQYKNIQRIVVVDNHSTELNTMNLLKEIQNEKVIILQSDKNGGYNYGNNFGIQYLQEQEKLNLEVASEFLVMAATLLDIKSKMLLPHVVNEEGEIVDPRQELVEQLLEYKKFKYISEELKGRQKEAEKHLFREATIPEEVLAYQEPVEIEKLLSDITLVRLHTIFQEVLQRQEEKIDPVRSRFGRIEKETVRLQDKIEDIRRLIRKRKQFAFQTLLEEQVGKMDVIVTFLAVLELGASRGTLTLAESIFFIIGVVSASFIWDMGMTTAFNVFRHKIPDKLLLWINLISGIIVVAYGIFLFVEGGKQLF